MLRKTTAFALAMMMGSTVPAFAAGHTVMMMGDGFFPSVVYLQDGDQVRFINGTDTAQSATAQDGSWTTGAVPVDGEFIVVINIGMQQVFLANDVVEATGTVFFGDVPLDD